MKLRLKFKLRYLYITLVLLIILAGAQYLRPIPPLQVSRASLDIRSSPAPSLPWPGYGQAGLGAVGFGVLATNGPQTPAPIASVAKVFTALAVLKQKPLDLNEQGPNITIDKTDVGYYNYYYTHDGSVTKVTEGEQLSEYQALQAMMLPSANNIADTLARWAFGSTDAYLTYANKMISDLGLTQTTIGSPSGFTASTQSTSADLVKIGLAAIDNPVLSQIVAQDKADITVAGTVHNVNWLLGVQGVNGIKTGNTNEAGGCYLYSAKQKVGDQEINIVGSVIGAPDLNQAIKDAKTILASSTLAFEQKTVITKGQVLGTYTTPWGSKTNAVASSNLSAVLWKGHDPTVSLELANKPSLASAGILTSINYETRSSVPIVLDKKIAGPSLAWRLFRF